MNSETIAQQVLQYVFAEHYRPSKPKAIHKGLKLPEESYRDLRRAIKKLVREGRILFGANHLVLRPARPSSISPSSPLSPTNDETENSASNSPSIKPIRTSLSDPAESMPRRPSKKRSLDSDDATRDEEFDGDALESDELSDEELLDAPEEFIDEPIIERRADRKPRKASAGDTVGIFRVAPNRQFGFVKLPRIAGQELADEVFIPPRYTKGAMDGDTVRIRITSQSGGKTEGIVLEIVSRGRREFSGTFQMIDEQAMVWLDGANLSHPVHIGDIRGLPVSNNDKIIVELVRYPDYFQPGEAVILRVLGSNKNPAVDTMAVMHQFNLVEEFPADAIEVARQQADAFQEEAVPSDRTDLTAVPTLTIDPIDARDFDDAISLCKNEKGNWELQVHIADVSHFVPTGSALDVEAQRRATSVYLPDRVIPMIPETISNHLASLQPDRHRLAKTVFMEYTPEGTLIFSRVFNSVIKNQHRFHYEQIDQFLADREPWREKLRPEIFQLVADMHELAMLLRRLRNEKGSLELTLPEVKIDLDKAGKVKGAHLVHHTESHQVIEEFMLAANQAVASWLDSLELPFLRRAHAPPNRLKLRQLNQFVRSLGIPAENLENRFEIQRVVAAVKGQPTEYAVNYAILKSMSKAIYQSAFERHYALDMTHYCHFTSPIRRYPDLVVHRIVQKLIEQKPAREDEQVLERLGEHCSFMEQNAEQAERELIRIKLLHFLSKKTGELMSGIVAGVKSNGLTVRAIEIPIDGLIPVNALPTDRYRFDRDTHTLEGFRSGNRYRLGDEVIVRIDKVDMIRRQLGFTLEKVTHHSNRSPLSPRREKRQGDSRRGLENLDKFKRKSKKKRR